MKKIMKNRITPYVVIFVGLMMMSVGAYQAMAATLTCSACQSWSGSCDISYITPGGQPSCFDISETECASRSCRRCDGTLENSVNVCVNINAEGTCNLTGETEDCGNKTKRVCEWGADGSMECGCPGSGGDPDGACQFQECTTS